MKIPAVLPVRIISHNVRHVTSDLFEGEKPWADRKQLVLNQYHYTSRTNPEAFLCLQEVHHEQLEDLISGLNTDNEKWDYIGVGRDDGKEAGEYSPIFYRPDVWGVEHWNTLWLSETPNTPSRGWDAASIRIVTIGIFKHHRSHQMVLAMCTHLDDQGSQSRYAASKLMIRQIHHYLRESEYAGRISGVFLAGDFNSEEDQEAYTELTGDDSPLVDASRQIDPALHYGNYNTYTGFGDEYPASRIDHVLVGPRDRFLWQVRGYSVLPNRFDDGVADSDHRAVVADVNMH